MTIPLSRRIRASNLRDEIDALARRLDLHLARLVTAENDGQASIAQDEALAAAHAIADRLEAFASPEVPEVGGEAKPARRKGASS